MSTRDAGTFPGSLDLPTPGEAVLAGPNVGVLSPVPRDFA
jgi:hypothetical protein